MPDELRIDFDPLHTLGFLAVDWIEAHCRVPGGVYEGEPLVLRGWQLEVNVNHYRIKPKAVVDPRRLLAPFHYRRSVIVGPQKSGKSPMGAAWLLFEGVGPALFAGWATGGEVYRCADHGCPCEFEYRYERGEAMGIPRRKSLLGLLAFAESQTANVYEPLQTMIHGSEALSSFIFVREGFIRLPGGANRACRGLHSQVGSAAPGGLGDSRALTASTRCWTRGRRAPRHRRPCRGRRWNTNPWDPMENSAASSHLSQPAGHLSVLPQANGPVLCEQTGPVEDPPDRVRRSPWVDRTRLTRRPRNWSDGPAAG